MTLFTPSVSLTLEFINKKQMHLWLMTEKMTGELINNKVLGFWETQVQFHFGRPEILVQTPEL